MTVTLATLRAAPGGAHPAPLLITKLAPPRLRPTLVPRPRLTEQLDLGSYGALTLISAPAGFGKTTLLVEWLRHKAPDADVSLLPSAFDLLPSQVAWVSLEEADNDPARFWAYVIGAVGAIMPSAAAPALALLQAPQPVPIEAVLTVLINALGGGVDELVLALDNYHTITAPAVRHAMTFLLDHIPSNLHLIVAGRTPPLLPLARLRAHGQLCEIGPADLRFTADETSALLRDVLRLPIDLTEIAALAARTEGWIAGLHLTALALQGRPDIPQFVRSLCGSYPVIADYLFDKVIQRQPPHIQTFLRATAILDRLSAPLCIAITGDAGSPAVLDYLERNQLFLTSLDSDRCWYRYHPLFAEALRARLPYADFEQARVVHRRAYAWYTAQGLGGEAVPHALAAGDLDVAADLIAQLADRPWLRGEAATLLRWLDALQGADPPARFAARQALLDQPLRWPAPPSPSIIHLDAIHPAAAATDRVSRREREVLVAIAAGLSTKEIAQRLTISPGTVKWHIENLYRKLDAGSRTQVVARARALGLLE